jgi:hypothetical protein
MIKAQENGSDNAVIIPTDMNAGTAGEIDSIDAEVDGLIRPLKDLLAATERLHKARKETATLKPLLDRLLAGELLEEADLEEAKTGIKSLAKLIKSHGEHRAALIEATQSRAKIDEILVPGPATGRGKGFASE